MSRSTTALALPGTFTRAGIALAGCLFAGFGPAAARTEAHAGPRAAARAEAHQTAAPVAPPPPMQDIAVDERVGARIPLDLRFTDTGGEPVRLGDYFGDGKPVLLVMAYSRCPMLCSLVLDGVAEVLGDIDGAPGRDYRVLTVSIDPEETPHEAARKQAVFLERLGRAGEPARWPFLVGQEQSVRSLADSLGFRYAWDPRTRQFAHPAVIFVLDPGGMISRYVNGVRFEPSVIESALRDAGAHRTGASNGGSILSCFRFESVMQRYGGAIETMFRVGALLIFAGVVAVVVLLFRRERKRRRWRNP